MSRRPFDVSGKVEVLSLFLCVALSVVLLVLPVDSRIRVADRLGLVMTSPYWRVRNFGEDVLRTRDENAWLRKRVLDLELNAGTRERMMRDADRVAGPALDPGFEGDLVPCRVIMRQRGRFATMIKIQSLEPVAWQPWQSVVTRKGYLGRLRTVISRQEAWVELLSAPDFALGVEVDRTGLLGVLHPRSDRFVVDMVGRDEDVQIGDRIITSGIAEIREGESGAPSSGYTARGFPVGTVTAVSSPSDMIFKNIVVQPAASLDANETVFVVMPLGPDPGLLGKP